MAMDPGPHPGYGTLRALLAVEGSRECGSVKEALARAGFKADVCERVDRIPEQQTTEGHSFLLLETKDEEWAVVRALRRRGAGIPVISLSGGSACTPLDPELGVVERLSTPFTLESLRRAIAKVSRKDRPGSTGASGGP